MLGAEDLGAAGDFVAGFLDREVREGRGIRRGNGAYGLDVFALGSFGWHC
jgi:hypothetical protein